MRTLSATLLSLALLSVACKHSPQHSVVPQAQPQEICGCMDVNALNHDPKATKCDPSQCKYAIDSVTGVYDIVDTYAYFTFMGPDTVISNMTLTVSRGSASALLFDTLLKCGNCPDGIPYNKADHSFSYSYYTDPYTSSGGSGYFEGKVLHYRWRVSNSLSSYTPVRWGSGVKRE